jgi:TatD DNase family protein
MKLFDSHAHLDMRRQSPGEVSDILARAFENDIDRIMVIAGADTPGEYDTALGIVDAHDRLYAAAGIHPHAASAATSTEIAKLGAVLHHPKIRALGEIGLDFHYNYSPPDAQRNAFVSQLRLARKHGLKVIVHTREADAETLQILKDEGADTIGGIIHCFSGGAALADGALALGFYLSFSGIVTFPKATEIQEIARAVPADRILAETDTPFLAPVPHRGRINEPAWVRHVVEKLADLRGVSADEMAATTWQNACTVFGIAPSS